MSLPTLVNSAAAAATTLTLPTGRAIGDLELMWVFRSASATAPTIPSGWTLVKSAGANTCFGGLYFRWCTSTSDTSGTWTSATHLICEVYRGVFGIGGATITTASGTSLSYGTLTMIQTAGNSLVVGFGSHRTATNVSTAPTGLTNRTSVGTGPMSASFDSNTGKTSWTATAVTVNASSGNVTVTAELLGDSSTFDPYTKTNQTLGSANTTATCSALGSGDNLARVGLPRSTGKWKFAVTPTTLAASSGAVGLVIDTHNTSSGVDNAGAVGFGNFNDGAGHLSYAGWNGTDTAIVTQILNTTKKAYVAVDTNNALIWLYDPNTSFWNDSASANPDTGTGGFNYTGLSGNLFPCVDANSVNDAFTWDGTASGAPSNASTFTAWDGAAGPTYTLALAQGSFALTGKPVNLLYGRQLSLAQGSYTLTGKPVGLLRGFKISLAQGAYALTGNAVSLLYGRKLSLAQGAISVAGQSVGLLFNRKLSLAQGSYSVTGNAVGLFRGFKLALAQGVYNLTGQAVGLLYNRKFSLGQGSYAINGQSLSVLRGYLLSLGQGAYTLSGQSVNLLRGYVLALGQGAISLTGQAVSLVYSGAGAATYTFALSCGSYALSGQALSVRYGRRLLLASGAYNLSGQPVSLLRGFRLALASGAYSIAGQAVALKRSYVMQLAAGLYAVAGQAINLVHATAGVFGYTPRFAFKAEQRNRTFKAEARDRTFTAAPNNRTFKAEARSRTFKADARNRTNED